MLPKEALIFATLHENTIPVSFEHIIAQDENNMVTRDVNANLQSTPNTTAQMSKRGVYWGVILSWGSAS